MTTWDISSTTWDISPNVRQEFAPPEKDCVPDCRFTGQILKVLKSVTHHLRILQGIFTSEPKRALVLLNNYHLLPRSTQYPMPTKKIVFNECHACTQQQALITCSWCKNKYSGRWCCWTSGWSVEPAGNLTQLAPRLVSCWSVDLIEEEKQISGFDREVNFDQLAPHMELLGHKAKWNKMSHILKICTVNHGKLASNDLESKLLVNIDSRCRSG